MNANSPTGFDIDERSSEGSVMLLLSGELDIASALRAQQTIARHATAPGTRAMTLDLSALSFIDSTGLAAIVYASRLCEQRGCELDAIRGPDTVQSVFELTGLSELLRFRDDGASATSS